MTLVSSYETVSGASPGRMHAMSHLGDLCKHKAIIGRPRDTGKLQGMGSNPDSVLKCLWERRKFAYPL